MAFENACDRAKIKDFHFHDLRALFRFVARDERNRYQGEDGTYASQNASYDPEILALLGRLQNGKRLWISDRSPLKWSHSKFDNSPKNRKW